jgi:hypothetical protein
MNPKFLFIFILIFITGLNLLWVSLNSLPPYYDSAGHTNLALVYKDIFTGDKPFHLKDFLTVSTFYPPLVHILGGIVGSIFGQDYKIFQIFSVFLFGLTSALLYFYVNELTKNRTWAFFSAIFFIFMPQLWEQSRYFMLDIPVITFVILSLFFLDKFNGSKSGKYLILSFVFAALGALVKWYALVYLIIPFSYALLKGLREPLGKETLFKFLPITVILFFAIALPWYLVNFKEILFWSNLANNPDFADPKNLLSLRNFLYYPTILLNYQVVSLQFIFLVASLFIFLKEKRKELPYILFQLLFIYLIFTILGNKNIRYTLPLLPFMAIIMAYTSTKIVQTLKGKLILTGLFLFSITLFTINSFGFPLNLDFRIYADVNRLNKNLDNPYFLDLSSKDIPYKFSHLKWSAKSFVEDILKYQSFEKSRVLVLANNPYVSVATLNLFNKEKQLLFEDLPPDEVRGIREEDIEAKLKEFEFIVVPDQTVATLAQDNYFNLEEFRKYILAGKTRDFALIKTYKLPNNDSLYLLKKDFYYNALRVQINGSELIITRPEAVANIYMQFMDPKFSWTQETIGQKETEFNKNLANIVRFRIDYPSRLINVTSINGWTYDQDKQFDRE